MTDTSSTNSAQAEAQADKAASENLPDKSAEGNQTRNSVSPKRKVIKSPRTAVVSGNDTDEVLTSRLVFGAYSRKSLSVKHLQRRLGDLGYHEALADRDGFAGDLTERAVHEWQRDNDQTEGAITAEQAKLIFEGDANVNVVVDTSE